MGPKSGSTSGSTGRDRLATTRHPHGRAAEDAAAVDADMAATSTTGDWPAVSMAQEEEYQDLALDELTPTEVKLREDVEKFRQRTLKEARHIIHSVMPTKLFQLDALVKSVTAMTAADMAQRSKYDKPIAAIGAGTKRGKARPSKKRKRDVSEGPVGEAVDDDDDDDDASSSLSSSDDNNTGPVYSHHVRSNSVRVGVGRRSTVQHVVDLANTIKRELVGLIDMCNKIKISIQLSIPRVEDGNNFGVSIQEDTISELGRAEDSAFVVLDSINKYYATRAKLTTKTIKYPNVEDYKRAVEQWDEKELANLRLCAVDLRNSVAILYDVINKNLDRIKKPRSSNAASMY